MIYSYGLFLSFMLIGVYFLYIRPKINVFNSFKSDPNFTNYMLVIESNKEFDLKSYEKAMKHLKLFLMYYSQSLDDENMFNKMIKQHNEIIKYLNRMLFVIPNSMRRYLYMKNAVDNLDIICKKYINEIVDKYEIPYIIS